MKEQDYQLIDSGAGQKLERFGPYSLIRPCQQAIWRPKLKKEWDEADAQFTRENGNKWIYRKKLPKLWMATIGGVQFQISPTDFGHLGVFPEHADLWSWMRPFAQPKTKILNLFAYSGGVTLAAAQEGAEVCHLDASKGMVDWARENAALNHLQKAPIRWIVDDAIKFMRREQKRGVLYDGIILDPPTFGRGSKGEVFKIEEEINPLLELCRSVMVKNPKFFIFSCHTPGFTPICMRHLIEPLFSGGRIETGEMLLHSKEALSIPSGSYARWSHA